MKIYRELLGRKKKADYQKYLSIRVLSGVPTIKVTKVSGTKGTLQYNIVGDDKWIDVTYGSSIFKKNGGSFVTDDIIMFRGTLIPNNITQNSGSVKFNISSGSYELLGNCMSIFGAGSRDFSELSTTWFLTYANACIGMFSNQNNLTNISANFLPSQHLPYKCYCNMFNGCSNLQNTPDLYVEQSYFGSCAGMFMNSGVKQIGNITINGASELCCDKMFAGCKSLTSIGSINLNDADKNSYQYMFLNAGSTNNVFNANTINIRKTAVSSHYRMFDSSYVSNAPNIPYYDLKNNVVTLQHRCFEYMFYNCIRLTNASNCLICKLAPYTNDDTMNSFYCCSYMFYGCTALKSGAQILADTTSKYCYSHMYDGCTSLGSTGALWANVLEEHCYEYMFADCRSIEYGPEQFANTGSDGNAHLTIKAYACDHMFYMNTLYSNNVFNKNCSFKFVIDSIDECGCNYMFYNINGFQNASNIEINAVAPDSYNSMFYRCINLNTPPIINTNTTALRCYQHMFSNCSRLSTTPQLTIEASTSGGAAAYCCSYMFYNSGVSNASNINLKDTASHSYEYMFASCSNISNGDNLPNMDFIILREYCCSRMFSGCTRLKNITKQLPCTLFASNSSYCYEYMFYCCTSLSEVCSNLLPGINLSPYCYSHMFDDCTTLTKPPKLQSNAVLNTGCYSNMFNGCSSLDPATNNNNLNPDYSDVITQWLPMVENLASHCYEYMFADTATSVMPELPAKKLKNDCYAYMFKGCKKLEYVDNSGVFKNDDNQKVLANACYKGMFKQSGVKYIPQLPVETLANSCYAEMFYGCKSLQGTNFDYTNGAYILPAKKLTDSCYSHMFTDCSSSDENVFESVILSINNVETIADGCYYNMFENTGIVNASSIKFGDKTSSECYRGMFYNCTSLTTAPALPATTLANSCYRGMFYNCTSLTTAPALPATTLASYCYYEMFTGCTALTAAPELPATTLKDYCYYGMFKSCTALTAAPELPATTLATLAHACYQMMFAYCESLTAAPALPATTLASYCYAEMFTGCTALTAAPELPATTLKQSCYYSMFEKCYSLTTAPELPATTLATGCYRYMFKSCTALTAAPELPATTLATYCYYGMFIGCTSLTSAPELPATTLADYCYNSMFYNCTSLTTAPALPATTLASYCYRGMFYNCTSLTAAPELPATELTKYCYYEMFTGCTALTAAPELPATTLVYGCYDYLFTGCKNINYINAAFTTTPGSDYTYYWLYTASSKGKFKASPHASWIDTIERGTSTVPSGWSITTT